MKYKGINYDVGVVFSEQFSSRPTFEIATVKRELQIIWDDLHCTSIRLCGTDVTRLTKAAETALELGLDVWFSPQLHNKNMDETLAYLVEAAKAAEILRAKWPEKVFFITGCELTWFMYGIMKGETFDKRLSKPLNIFQMLATKRYSKKLNAFLANVVGAVRKEFHGQVTYAGAAMEKVDWTPFDLIGLDYYRDTQNAARYGSELEKKYAAYKKPIVITEVGLCAYRGAEKKGALGHAITQKGENGHMLKPGFVRDEDLQARELVDMLRILDKNSVAGAFVFLFAWPTFPYNENPTLDLDMASYSIVKTLKNGRGATYSDMPWEPKKAFLALAKFYESIS